MAITDPLLSPQTVPMTPETGAAPFAEPDPYADKAAILSLVRDKMGQWSRQGGRELLVLSAWRNLLFEMGYQWIELTPGLTNTFRALPKSSYNGPRPVTNRFSSTMRAFGSVLARVEPLLNFRPATDDPEDRATAEIAGRVIEVVEDEVNIRELRQHLAWWCAYTGGAWLEWGYDPSPEHGMRTIQHEQCQQCGAVSPPTTSGACANCGGPTQPAVDEAGEPIGHEVPIGRMYADVCSIFEMYFDLAETTQWRKIREYIRKKSLPRDAAVRQWGEIAKSLTSDVGQTMGESYQDQLPTLGSHLGESQATTDRPIGIVPGRGTPGGKVSEMWYRSLPTEQYPEGLLACVLGNSEVVYAGPLPYEDERGKLLGSVYYPTNPVPGRLLSKSVGDDLAPIQVKRNKLEAMIEMITMRTANPVWFVPMGSNVKAQGFTGIPGQVIEYNALGPSPAKPERVQGASIPNGLITRLEMIDHDFEEQAATFSVMKGDRPPNVSAGIALQMLQERANHRFGPMYILWEQAWAESARIALAIFRQYVTEERMLEISGRGSRWRVQKFLGSDLTGRVNVVPEAGSSMPRSTLVDRAELEQLSANGIVNPQDPEIQEKWLEAFGRTSWLPGMKADAENTAKHIEFFESLAGTPQAVALIQQVLQMAAQQAQAAMQPPNYQQVVLLCAQAGLEIPEIRPTIDDHMTMARELRNWLRGEDSQALPKPIQKLAELKQAGHSQVLAMQQMQAMAGRAGTFPTAGFMSNPGGQVGPAGQPPSRMDGEAREMQEQAAG